jgi:uncharacterized membrane protein YsdA (DUF1294 family)
MSTEHLLFAIFAAINIFAFVVVANDKRKSMQYVAERTPEGLLFFLAAAFGAVGVFAAMQTFRHKTKKWYFLLGIPLLILQNLAVVYFVVEISTKSN